MSMRAMRIFLAFSGSVGMACATPQTKHAPSRAQDGAAGLIAYAWPIEKIRIAGPTAQALDEIMHHVPFLAVDVLPEDRFQDPNHPPYGMRIDTSAITNNYIQIDTEAATGRQIIDEFLRQEPRYTALEDGDWVILMPKGLAEDPSYPLNIVVDHVTVSHSNLVEAAVPVVERAGQIVGRRIFVRDMPLSLSRLQSLAPPSFHMSLSSRTVRNMILEASANVFQPVRLLVSNENGDQVINFTPSAFPSSWFRVNPIRKDSRVPRSVIRVLERRHREGLATPQWHP